MTVEGQKTYQTIYGTGSNIYKFNIQYIDQENISVVRGLEDGRKIDLVYNSDYTIQDGNFIEFIYQGGSIKLVTPLSLKEYILIFREPDLSQDINYEGFGNDTYRTVEYACDKLTLDAQAVYSRIEILEGDIQSVSKFPDPSNRAINELVLTDGNNSFKFGCQIDLPTADGQTLVSSGGAYRIVQSPGIQNPPIPQPSSTNQPLVANTAKGGYYLSNPRPIMDPTDDGYSEIFDGNSWQKIKYTGATNPPIPQPTIGTLSTYDSNYEIVDDRSKFILLSNHVESGIVISTITGSSIAITEGVINFVLPNTNVNDNRLTRVGFSAKSPLNVTFAGTTNTYLYANSDGTYSFESFRTQYRIGTKILIADIEHNAGNIIYIKACYISLPSLLGSLNIFAENARNNVSDMVLTANGRSLSYSQGVFRGYNANLNNDKYLQHEVSIPAVTNATIRFILSNGIESTSATMTMTEGYESTSGTVTAIPSNNAGYFAVWIYPNGMLKIQRPTQIYNNNAIPSLDVWLALYRPYRSLTTHGALFAAILYRPAANFGTGANDTIIYPVNNWTSGVVQTVPSGTSAVPAMNTGNIRNLLIGRDDLLGGRWSGFKIKDLTSTDSNKLLYYDFTNNTIDTLSQSAIGVPEAESLICNGVLTGVIITAGSSGFLTISPGKLVFVSDIDGIPTSVTTLQYTGVTNYSYTFLNGTYYVLINNTGALSITTSPTTSNRGNTINIAKITIVNGVITRIKYLYTVLQSAPSQIKELLTGLKNTVSGVIVSAHTTSSIKNTTGTMYGYNVNAVNKSFPHTAQISSAIPSTFRFFRLDGTESTDTTTFPAIPSVELTPGIITTLANTKIGFYPVYIFPNGNIGIQYSSVQYDSYTQKTIDEWYKDYVPSQVLAEDAALVAVIKWKSNETFLTTNVIDNSILTKISGNGGGGSIPLATTNDINRLVTIDNTGKYTLGIQLENADGMGLSIVGGKSLIYSGSKIIADYPSVELSDNKIEKRPVMSDNGKLKEVKDGDYYLTPSVYSINVNVGNYVEPVLIRASFKGVSLDKFTLNNAPDGGTDRVLKYTEIITNSIEYTNVIGQSGNSFLDPQVFNTNIKQLLSNPFANLLVAPRIIAAGGGLKFANAGINTYFNNNQITWLYSPTISIINIGIDQSANNLQDRDFFIIDRSSTGKLLIRSVEFFALDLSNIPKPWVASYTINIPSLNISGSSTEFTTSSDPLNIEMKVFAPSDDPNANTHNNVFIIPVKRNQTLTENLPINFNKTFIFSSNKTSYNYGNVDNVPITSNFVYFGIAPKSDIFNPLNSSTTNYNRRYTIGAGYISNLTIVAKGANSSLNTLRFEAPSINAAQTTYVGLGHKAPLKPGNIVVYYQLLNVTSLASGSVAGSKPSLKGIVFNPFDSSTYPELSIEDQTGTTPATNRNVAEIRFVRDSSFIVYHFTNLTQTQLDSWKLVMRFKTTTLPTGVSGVQSLFTELGATLWFVNGDEA